MMASHISLPRTAPSRIPGQGKPSRMSAMAPITIPMVAATVAAVGRGGRLHLPLLGVRDSVTHLGSFLDGSLRRELAKRKNLQF